MDDNLVSNDLLMAGSFELDLDTSVTFQCGEVILVLDEKGMVYKGERIEDAGEAHRVFLEVLYMMRSERGE